MNEKLLNQAMETKALYKMGIITRDEAKRLIKPYADYFNEKSKEIAKKYNQKAQKFNFSAFMR